MTTIIEADVEGFAPGLQVAHVPDIAPDAPGAAELAKERIMPLGAKGLESGRHMRNVTDAHRRHSIRLKGYDYSQPGSNFVTIVTQDRLCLFGDGV